MNITYDSLTVEPEPNSTVVGRATGLYVSAGLDQLGLLRTFTFVFTTEKYNGSTLSVLGWNPVLDTYREISIIGESSVFRLARGTATCKTTWLNLTTGDAVVEYNVVALHY
ncbi:hypothetical protein Vadar_028565 [Vaccinium darrowii]|uniref:Uncharacterized protein n=1 Tax=Vaccinium darrowii TaxID=229202 RepID=A0ACB7Y350_9ERIC|nr:hypothetical protein Vadar_028565 [Vaccinium darrowii]